MVQLATGPGRTRNRRGATLLVSIAILTLLAVFSVAFVQLVNFERNASANYVDAVHARMLARAGIQRAIAELQRKAAIKHYSDVRAVADGGDGWAFEYRRPEKDAGGNSYGRPLSLLTTSRPSFRMSHPNLKMFGRPLEYSGAMASKFVDGLDVYKLKVIDAASQLNLNHPDPVSIQRMLKNLLVRASDLDPTWDNLTDGEADQLAAAVITRRPLNGFTSISEVEVLLSQPIVGATKNVVVPAGTPGLPNGANRWIYPDVVDGMRLPLRDMLTVDSWVDNTVIRPWNLNGEGRRDLAVMPRAPINLNTASKPVLTAILAELSGSGRFGSADVSYASAVKLANKIHERVREGGTTGKGPFKTWLEFERWLDGPLSGSGAWDPEASPTGPGYNLTAPTSFAVGPTSNAVAQRIVAKLQLQRDLVKAALNPNSILNKWGAQANHGGSRHPDFMLPRLIDKADLIQHNTEACFDSMGVYDITSLGMVLIKNDREDDTTGGLLAVAEQTQQAIVRVYDVFRLSTQADFEGNRALQAAGDFIESFDRKWTYTVPGVNRPKFGPKPLSTVVPRTGGNDTGPYGFDGWPGVTSYPVYSLHRDVKERNFTLQNQYVAADWDGSLMLSNLLAVPVQPSDFVVCFARGEYDAFKVRAWWEPKDQEPSSGVPLPGLELKPTRGHDPEAAYVDLTKLATPLGFTPRKSGLLSNESNPLDAVAHGPNAATTDATFFEKGSALTAHGAIVHPRRHLDTPTEPSVLVYPGDNIDLIQGTSIRFWVMPTDDPFAQSEEVLFSFIGSRDETSRDVGFRVVKRTVGPSIRVFLETVNRASAENDLRTGTGAGLGTPDSISLDVTPGDDPSDILKPRWETGTWHWVVVNFGPQVGGVSQTATLQIDKKRGSLLGTDVINMAVTGNGGSANYGSAHGNEGGSATLPGYSPNINRTGVVAWVGDRLLGEWYHCDLDGRSVDPNDDSRTFPNAVRWSNSAGGGAGGYVVHNSFPTNPFPDGSYNRRLKLHFVHQGGPNNGTEHHNANMEPANGSGLGGTGWTYNFADVDMGTDLTGGTSDDYRIDIEALWTMDGISGGSCTCCTDCGTHDIRRKRYWGRNNDNGGQICRMIYKGALGPIVAGGRLPPPTELPMQFVCDQCHGCEACDVDAPMFFGGEPEDNPARPNARLNYVIKPAPVGRTLNSVNRATTARAIFDNIIIKNNKERRTDSPGVSDLPGKDFEDRFFETSLATATASSVWNETNFGAIYRRGLLELVGIRTRLGTLSWTSYPTSDGDYDFVTALYRMNGGAPGNVPTYDSANPGPLNDRLKPVSAGGLGPNGVAYTTIVDGAPRQIGYRFDAERALDTSADPTAPASTPYPKELLVLSVQFSQLLSSAGDRAAEDPGSGEKLYPQPLRETPIFEDITLTLILESPQILYAEEGVEE